MLDVRTRWFARVAATRWGEWSAPVVSVETPSADMEQARALLEDLLGRPRELLMVAPYGREVQAYWRD